MILKQDLFASFIANIEYLSLSYITSIRIRRDSGVAPVTQRAGIRLTAVADSARDVIARASGDQARITHR